MMKAMLAILVLFAPFMGRIKGGPITEDQAKAVASHFVNAIYGSSPAASGAHASREDIGTWAQYKIEFPTLKGLDIQVDAADGYVCSVYDYRVSDKRRKGLGRNQHYRLSSAATASKYIDGLAKKIGLPRGWSRTNSDYYRDHTPGRGDSDQCGRAFAGYCPKPEGYPFLNYGPKMMIEVDPLDGRLLNYFFVNHTQIGTVDIRVTPAQAIATAKRAVVLPNEHRRHVVTGKPKLGWAVPNAGFGSPLPDGTAKPPFKAFLGYEIRFNDYITGGRKLSESWVWVDAKTGKVLGGDGTK